jgi:hypothetical protein
VGRVLSCINRLIDTVKGRGVEAEEDDSLVVYHRNVIML